MYSTHKNQSGHTLLIALLGVVLVAAVVVVGWRVKNDNKAANTANTPPTSNSTATTPNSTSNSSAAATIPAGTSNSDLNNDLSSINSSISQDNSNASAANTAINDQQNQITVPTN